MEVTKWDWSHTKRSLSSLWWLQIASGGWSLVHRWLSPERGSVGISPCEALGLHVHRDIQVSQETLEGGSLLECVVEPLAAPHTWITLA